jgi:FKBP-type peptidyl-prolyl cis-trans isomerase
MHRLLLPLSTLLLLLTACGRAGDPAEVTFAPALNVDLGAMTHTESGLYFQDVTVGTADPAASDGRVVSVHYTGWLASGEQIDTSRDDDRPFSFTLGQGRVIQGWEEGLQGMRVGGQRRLVLPSWLAYGDEWVGKIPPNSVLVFDVELMAVR